MCDKDFFIYADRSKLRIPSSTEYRVEKLLDLKHLKQSVRSEKFILFAPFPVVFRIFERIIMFFSFVLFITDCKTELTSEGAPFILKHFDKLFSIIEYIDHIDYNDLHDVYDEILVKSKLNEKRIDLLISCTITKR